MSGNSDKKFSCLIIGGGTLPIRCGEIVIHAGHDLSAIVSDDREVKRWAAEAGIPCVPPGIDLADRINGDFDYLFSIVNEQILSDGTLRLPRKLAINYHDGPLPRYAGTHATSWALINGETTHGISWHIVADKVDAGDVLIQRPVEISSRDTALTLNTKCYEAAINAFAELVENLADGSIRPKPQDLNGRTFFARTKRPSRGGMISWADPANKIADLVRALDFGDKPNPLGVAKFAVGDDIFSVSNLEVLNSEPWSAPGTINKIGRDFLQVSCSDKELLLRETFTLDGRPISASGLTEEFNLREGHRLRDLSPENADQLEALYAASSKDERYWLDKLSSLEPVTPPYANNVAQVGTPNHASITVSLPAEFLMLGNELGQDRNRDDLVISAFAALIARLNAADVFDVCYSDHEIGTEYRAYNNFFAAGVPLRLRVDCSRSFADLVTDTGQEINTVKQRKIYALDMVARFPQLCLARRSGGDDLMLPIAIVRVERREDYIPIRGSQLALVISKNDPAYSFVFDQNKITPENMRRLVTHFGVLLNGIAADSKGPVAFLPLLNDTERSQLLLIANSEFQPPEISRNGGRHEFEAASIARLFELQVGRTPDATALIFGKVRLTYQELNRRANQIANHLRGLGVAPEVLVGVCMDRSVEMVTSILAVLKAGGAYVPLDPAYPRERVEYMLADSQASILLTKKKFVDSALNFPGQKVFVDDDGRIERESADDPVSSAKPTHLAYVIYTSGSTGKPKGVAIEHRSTVALVRWALSAFRRERLKGVLASTSICFDLSVYELFVPLSCGGAIVLVENILHLPEAPAANEVTLINTVPSAITELLRINGIPSSVRTVNLAGEPLKTSLVRQIYDVGTVKEVYDLYGPTEDTTYSTFTLRNTERATIGRPISNTQAFILDRYLQLVPTGIPGELYLGGDGLARGYLNRPELTSERFIKNIFSDEPSARLYKTGDLVRYLRSGDIEYLGRIDNQVKIRGFRIELGEIEAVLASHPGVMEAVVIAREDQPGDERLAAYFVSEAGQTVEANDLRDYLKDKLPDHMVPSAVLELDEMPLTLNGKIDRKALPAPRLTTYESSRDLVVARDDLESKLVDIWESILGVQPIGIRDNFFDLGGHSLNAVRMFAEVEDAFGKNIPLATLFEASTIEMLADILRQDGWAAPESSLVPIQPNGTRPPFFCVHAKGGNVLFYKDLAHHLGMDQPFYGIQARRLAGRQVGHATVEEMATFYIEEIQKIQPDGPYYVGGSSFGGLAAFEIAQQLDRLGERVGLVALLDTGTPDYPKPLPNVTRVRARIYGAMFRARQHKDSLLSAMERDAGAEYILSRLKKIKLKYRRKVHDTYKKAVRKLFLKTRGVGSIPKNYIQIEDQLWKAGQNYSPQVYPGKVTLFRASNQPLGIHPDPTLGWGPLVTGELEIHEVPGHHGSIVTEPYVRTLARELRSCLDRVQTEARNDGKIDVSIRPRSMHVTV